MPGSVCVYHLGMLLRLLLFVTANLQFAAPGNPFCCFVLNDYVQTGTRPKRVREWIMDQAVMPPFPLEAHMSYVKAALARIANGYRSLRVVAAPDSAENRRSRNRQPPRRCTAGHRDGRRTERIVARHGNYRGLWAEAGGLEAYGDRHGVAWPNRYGK